MNNDDKQIILDAAGAVLSIVSELNLSYQCAKETLRVALNSLDGLIVKLPDVMPLNNAASPQPETPPVETV